jgi:GNAT superfamily N-acetyltransferase
LSQVRVEDLDEENIDDVFRVCSHNRLDDPLQQRGIEFKRRWLLEMLAEHGPCTKIAYLGDKPVAQILFYPEEAAPFIQNLRRGVVVLHCAYNPFPEARGKGVGTALLRSLVDDCGRGLTCLGGVACRFIAAKPFNTGEGMPLNRFYAANGFEQAEREMFLEVSAPYQPREISEYRPLGEDRGRAVMLYNPICEWSYQLAVRVGEFLKEIDAGLPVELIDEWRNPEESIKRGNQWLVVNAKPVRSPWTQREALRHEVEQALGR